MHAEKELNDGITKTPIEFLQGDKCVKICAPMVRYSKLAFRSLVRKYDCDVCFTPMIVADSFVKSLKARDSEFTTNSGDRPLIVQFAARNAEDFAAASEIVQQFADGVDLNCGCPQRWAMSEGYGACLIKKPDLLTDMVAQTRARIQDPDFSVSIKIRIQNNERQTVELCQRAEHAGVSWIAVHGRTPAERTQPVNYDIMKLIQSSVSVPVVANGDIKSLQDVKDISERTGVKGVMCARGILQNPAMFAGYNTTPKECIKQWIELSLSYGTSFQCFHNHLIYMLEDIIPKSERLTFNSLTSVPAVISFLNQMYDI
ncbi:unnamed protein product [Owenia fusiformis]|uniref:tRNA-dihydrouridine synthase n=1 Tax=Owenia fusiformis TaxID=6347 RepID=A0A8J1TYZ0_OWEFU|nr:unnamed protein product [Owenia fusiformis]